jgi:putative addiction module killer protein
VFYELHSSVFTIKQTAAYRKWEFKLRDRTARALIAARIVRLREGLMGDVASVGDGVSEMRIHFGPGYRVYFTRRDNEIIVLLCGGDKASQQADIAAAKRLAAQWSDTDG